jgi:hypothetical protein
VLNQNSSAAQQAAAQAAITVAAGSMVEVGDDIVPVVKATPRSLQNETMTATDVEPPRAGGGSGPTHALRNTIIGIAVSGAVAGIVVGTTRGGPGCNPNTVAAAGCAPK